MARCRLKRKFSEEIVKAENECGGWIVGKPINNVIEIALSRGRQLGSFAGSTNRPFTCPAHAGGAGGSSVCESLPVAVARENVEIAGSPVAVFR